MRATLRAISGQIRGCDDRFAKAFLSPDHPIQRSCELHSCSRAQSRQFNEIRANSCFRGCALYLPDASSNCAHGSGLVPHLRHGSRAHGSARRSRGRPRIRLHAQAILDQRSSLSTASRSIHARRPPRSASRSNAFATGLNSFSRRPSSCGAAGRSSSASGIRWFTAARTCSR